MIVGQVFRPRGIAEIQGRLTDTPASETVARWGFIATDWSAMSDVQHLTGEATPIPLERGVFITFEGPDGCGKSTLAKGCMAHLKSKGYSPVALSREPGHSPAGKRIRALGNQGRGGVTPEEELALFLEDRRFDIENNISPIVEQRGVALLDRYYHSSIAYQGARGLDPVEIRRRNETEFPRPDMIVLLQLDVDICLERIEAGRGEQPNLFEQRGSLERVIAIFDAMPDAEIRRFDAAQSPEDLQREVCAAIEALLAPLHAR